MSFIGPRRTLLSGSALRPTWSWDFAARQAAPPGASFSRASTAACFDGAGVLRTANSNIPRFDCNPRTGAPLGYLAEMQSTNAIANSRALAGAGWSQNGVTATDNAAVSPDGTANAAKMVEDTSTGGHVLTTGSLAIVTGSVYGGSFYVKNITGSRWVQFYFSQATSPIVSFNPSTGTLGALGAGAQSVQVQVLPNGWYRISVLWTAVSSTAASVCVYMNSTNSGASVGSYAGDGTSAIAVWGVQFETAGVGVTSLIQTSGAAATRAQDVLTMPLASLPGWSLSQGGVLVAAYRLYTQVPSAPGYNQYAFSLNDGSANNVVSMLANYSGLGQFGGLVLSGGVGANDVGATAAAPFVRRKHALGWGINSYASFYDGTYHQVSSPTLTLPVAPTNLNFGTFSSGGFSGYLNGALESIAYYRGVRSRAFVQQASR